MPHVMKCHYEVLEVERNADANILKKQYRKLALKVKKKLVFKFVIYNLSLNFEVPS